MFLHFQLILLILLVAQYSWVTIMIISNCSLDYWKFQYFLLRSLYGWWDAKSKTQLHENVNDWTLRINLGRQRVTHRIKNGSEQNYLSWKLTCEIQNKPIKYVSNTKECLKNKYRSNVNNHILNEWKTRSQPKVMRECASNNWLI